MDSRMALQAIKKTHQGLEMAEEDSKATVAYKYLMA